jgi:hypothetical protein
VSSYETNAAMKLNPKDQHEMGLWHMSGKGQMMEKEMAEGNPHLHVELQMLMAFVSGEYIQWFCAEAEMQQW